MERVLSGVLDLHVFLKVDIHVIVCFPFCSYSRDLTGILWPRFRRILELNIASVRDTNPSRLGNIDTRPHYVCLSLCSTLSHTHTHTHTHTHYTLYTHLTTHTHTHTSSLPSSQITRRYAEFSAALVSINQSHPDDQVDQCLSALQGEVENFILRMAAEFPQRREQLVFLINNYDMMLSVITVSCFFMLFHLHDQRFCLGL